MKKLQSLLLGSAAGIAAVAGAQAADLPVKAKAVEYVKICSLYGAGYYYIPGTDTCLKVGGYVRSDVTWDAYQGWAFSPVPTFIAKNPDRATNDLFTRARGVITLDARSQTEYGTLRSYISVGANTDGTPGVASTGAPGATGVQFDRAFIQLAGFTIGKTISFADVWGFTPFMANMAPLVVSDSGATGIWLVGYTAQLGNGVSASVSLEDPAYRRHAVVNASVDTIGTWTAATQTAALASSQRGTRFFDVVGSLRVDQPWGWAAITGALHDISGQYYTAAVGGGAHPSDAVGWAVTAGGFFKVPGMNGDTFGIQFVYGQGAMGYVLHNAYFAENEDGSRTIGVVTDGVYANNMSIEKTSGWAFNTGYEHWWVPAKLRSSIFGGYAAVSYNATANQLLCGGAAAVAAGCNLDFSLYQVGSRSVWTPVLNLDLSLEVVYSHINSGVGATAGLTYGDTDMVTGMFRAQRNFWP